MNIEELYKYYGLDKNWPEDVPRHIDYDEITMGENLKRTAEEFPGSDAVVFEGFRMTYKELDIAANQFAAGLSKLGIGKDDVILIDLPNVPQFIIAFYAIVRLGAVANPIIPLNRYVEIVHQSNDSKAKALIILDVLYEEHLHGEDLRRMSSLEHIIMTEVAEYLPPLKARLGKMLKKVPFMEKWPSKAGDIPVHRFQDIFASGMNANVPEVNIDVKNDPAVLIYTGGTTGVPKGVMTSHYNLIVNAQQANAWSINQLAGIEETRGKGGMIIVLPLAHAFALSIGMSIAVNEGYKMILFARPPDDLSKILKAIKKENATFCPGVPTLWNKINQNPGSAKYRNKLASFRACLSGASALPLEVKKRFEDITGAQILEGYGMSEASPLLTVTPFMKYRENTVGLPVSDTFLKITDLENGDEILSPCTRDSCTDCGPDESEFIGEICGTGPQIMLGYLGREEETAYALRKDDNGVTWYFTSDIGCIDKDGYLRIKDRKRDMIKYKGHAVFPREVEDLIYLHEAVNEVGVVGVPDTEVGQNIKAFISLKPEFQGKVSKEDILEWCKKNISPFKYPRTIELVPELPKTIIGKILRRELRKGEE